MSNIGIPIVASQDTTRVIEYALHGLDRRTEVIANNVANAEVPGFLGSRVDFEANLARAISAGDLDDRPDLVVQGTGEQVGVNGNNVRLESELTELMKTKLMQQAMINAYNFKVDVTRTAIGSR
jgi:flagellar basal-body rod protein FlgB